MLASLLLAPAALLLAASPNGIASGAERQNTSSMLETSNHAEAQPATGTLILRPGLSSTSPDPTRVINIELVFTAVDRTESGDLVPRRDIQQQTYTVGYGRSYRREDRRDNYDDYHTRVVDLPSGSYTLSEVRYDVEDRGSGTLARPDMKVTYCLSDRSFLFNVGGGEVVSLGGVAIADLPRNRGQFGDHNPVAGIDMMSALIGASDDSGYFSFASIVDTAFERDSGICTNTRYDVAGW
ncbi:MAG: hypothetical protein AAF683_14100 [Pseudomonadota bacterium]